MALVLTDEQAMIREAADGFFASEAPVSELRRLRDAADATGFSRDLWKQMAEMGFAGVLVPEAHGGSGLGLVAANLIQEAVGRNLSLSPFLSTAVLGATALSGASEDQKAVLLPKLAVLLERERGRPTEWHRAGRLEAQYERFERWSGVPRVGPDALLPKLAAGDLLLALASDEASRHAPHLIRTRAEAAGNGFRLTGAKTFVLDGHVADRLIFDARAPEAATRPGGLGMPFDWTLLKGVDPGVPFMLSGGLDMDNVAEALRITNAPGVDVSSGVERKPSVKDPNKIRAFIRAARAADILQLAASNIVSSA